MNIVNTSKQKQQMNDTSVDTKNYIFRLILKHNPISRNITPFPLSLPFPPSSSYPLYQLPYNQPSNALRTIPKNIQENIQILQLSHNTTINHTSATI
jgi:hypothetical protein